VLVHYIIRTTSELIATLAFTRKELQKAMTQATKSVGKGKGKGKGRGKNRGGLGTLGTRPGANLFEHAPGENCCELETCDDLILADFADEPHLIKPSADSMKMIEESAATQVHHFYTTDTE
jgi:hypothetical protein